MTEQKHIIWSNHHLDYEDWKDDLEAEFPDMTESQRIQIMYDRNSDYLDDERTACKHHCYVYKRNCSWCGN